MGEPKRTERSDGTTYLFWKKTSPTGATITIETVEPTMTLDVPNSHSHHLQN